MIAVAAPRHADAVLGSDEIWVEGRDRVSGKQRYTTDMKTCKHDGCGLYNQIVGRRAHHQLQYERIEADRALVLNQV